MPHPTVASQVYYAPLIILAEGYDIRIAVATPISDISGAELLCKGDENDMAKKNWLFLRFREGSPEDIFLKYFDAI